MDFKAYSKLDSKKWILFYSYCVEYSTINEINYIRHIRLKDDE